METININQRVYCRATNDGKGVIEALEARGGVNTFEYNGKKNFHFITKEPTETFYYIDNHGRIKMVRAEGDWFDLIDMLQTFYTEIPPLVPPRWRAKKGESFWYITSLFTAAHDIDLSSEKDNLFYQKKNYFPNEHITTDIALELQEAFEKILEKYETTDKETGNSIQQE